MKLSPANIATLMDCYIMTTHKGCIISSSDSTSINRLYSLGLVEAQDDSKMGRLLLLSATGLDLAQLIIDYANEV